MKFSQFVNLFLESVKDLVRKPILLLPGLLLFGFIFGFSELGGKVAYSLQSTQSNTLWVIFSTIFLLGIGAIISVSLVLLASNSKIRKVGKYFVRTFVILLLYLVLFNLINLVLYIFTLIMSSLSNAFVLPISIFSLLIFIIYFLFIAGPIIFLTFSHVFVVTRDASVKKAISLSFGLVRKEYLATLSMSVLLFVIVFLVGLIESLVGDIIQYVVIVPLTFVIFTRFVLERY